MRSAEEEYDGVRLGSYVAAVLSFRVASHEREQATSKQWFENVFVVVLRLYNNKKGATYEWFVIHQALLAGQPPCECLR